LNRKLIPHILLIMTAIALSLPLAAEDSNPASKAAPAAGSAQTQGQVVHWGSVNPENLPPMFSLTDFRGWLEQHRIRYYGWLDGGGYYASTGYGEQQLGFPTINRFADEPIIDAAWVIVDRPLPAHSEGWEWGFRGDFYAGQDAALLRPYNSFGPQSARFGTDFRQAYISIHAPIITKGGLDLQLGRQNVPIGYESLMGPYRPLYSESYYWIFHQVGSTAAFGTLHVNKQLDVLAGADLNYNTVFKLRGRAPSYLAKAIYSPSWSRKTSIIGDVYTGPQPVPTLTGHLGTWQTLSEVEVRRNWSPRVSQVVQGSYEWDFNDPAEKKQTSVAQGAFSIVTVHMTRQTLDLNLRGEWMHDLNGIRTHFPGTFGETTAGLNVMPVPWINIRPEIRGDFATSDVLGPLSDPVHKKNQLTAGGDIIFKF
jgi:hypothetical protein